MDDANSQNTDASSSDAKTAEAPVTTQESANDSTESQSKNVPFHEHPRFQELVREKQEAARERDEVKARLERMESIASKAVVSREDSEVVNELVDLGLDNKNAEKLLKVIDRVASKRAQKEIEPIAQRSQEATVNSQIASFESGHPEFSKYKDKMNDIYSKLSPQLRQALHADLKGGLELLLSKAKEGDLESIRKESEDKGRQEAYQNKSMKQAISSSKGGPSGKPGDLSAEAIEKMDMATYLKNKPLLDEMEKNMFLGR